MAGEPFEHTELGGDVDENPTGDTVDAKPDRKGRFLLFGK